MIDDAELLRRYAAGRAEEAFAELVRRHVNFVYACALRRVGGDAHLAEDVTQQVFTKVAREAAALARRDVLSGWLYTTARHASAQVVRGERRRAVREQEAHIMNELTATSAHDAEWERLRPVIDEAMDDLREEDREAVLLRFFEGKSFGEIGAKLRLSENTARMRVERALDTLHGRLAQRGVTSTAVALGAVLAGQAGVAAPAGLAASATAVALAGGGVLAGGAGWVTFMSVTKLQLGIVSAVAVAGATGYVVQGQTNAELRREISVVRAQQAAVVALKAENQRLASAAAEVEILRRDDGELKQLEQRVAEVKRLNEERVRLAQARVQNRRTVLEGQLREKDRRAQEEVDRMNQEGNALVVEFKALDAGTKNGALTPEARAELDAAVKAKLAEIWAKQREVQEFIKNTREALKQSPEMTELRGLPPGPGGNAPAEPTFSVGQGKLELRRAGSSGAVPGNALAGPGVSGAISGSSGFKFVPGPKPASQP